MKYWLDPVYEKIGYHQACVPQEIIALSVTKRSITYETYERYFLNKISTLLTLNIPYLRPNLIYEVESHWSFKSTP